MADEAKAARSNRRVIGARGQSKAPDQAHIYVEMAPMIAVDQKALKRVYNETRQ